MPVYQGKLEQYLQLPFTKGYGEFAFYLDKFEHLEADDPEMIETYEILEKRNQDMPALLKMIEKYYSSFMVRKLRSRNLAKFWKNTQTCIALIIT